ncbi:MAG TPA: protein-glutamate O-methyltransferase CheR [Candidatus Acidoferrales bacterium]|nr:protein-glutamate O-methyltransferase CheR [Candidatus Acidoferrales bacterium]
MAEQTLTPNVTEHELKEVRTMIERRSGVHFDESRERFFAPRVREYMLRRRLSHGMELLRALNTSNAEYDSLLEELLTQETRFFRYPELYAAFERKVLPEQHMKKFWETPRSLRIWSAGCATGEEPYSIAISLCESLAYAEAWNINVLATDISRQALDIAERGRYGRRALENVPPRQLEMYFVQDGDEWRVRPKLRNLVNFATVNLAQPMYLGRFDVIFCMNVLIYFTDERRAAVVQRFYDSLEPGGYLFLGHAESVAGLPTKFNTVMYGESRLLQKPTHSGVPSAAAGEGQR